MEIPKCFEEIKQFNETCRKSQRFYFYAETSYKIYKREKKDIADWNKLSEEEKLVWCNVAYAVYQLTIKQMAAVMEGRI